jgi:hypothetical protein
MNKSREKIGYYTRKIHKDYALPLNKHYLLSSNGAIKLFLVTKPTLGHELSTTILASKNLTPQLSLCSVTALEKLGPI